MKIMDKLWSNYLSEECARVETEEGKRLAMAAIRLHEEASSTLTEEQVQAMEKYVDAICDTEESVVKEAFFKGCAFTFSFLLRLGAFGE